MIYRVRNGRSACAPRRKTHDPVHMSKHLLLGGKVEDPPLTHVPSMQESWSRNGFASRSGAHPLGGGGGGGGRWRIFKTRERKTREKTYVLVCGVRSLCRRFLNQLATWVKVKPVSFAKFFFSSESGYLVLM